MTSAANRSQDLRDCSLGSLAELSLILSKDPPIREVRSLCPPRFRHRTRPFVEGEDDDEDNSQES
jgi:hypothetical protein